MKTKQEDNMFKEGINFICSIILGFGVMGGLGWLVWNIFGPAAYQMSWADAGILVFILALFGYAITKKK